MSQPIDEALARLKRMMFEARIADVIVPCPVCRQKNKIQAGRRGPRCAKCGLPLKPDPESAKL